jgi:hypothetical protein
VNGPHLPDPGPKDHDELVHPTSDPTPEQLDDPNYCGPGSPDWDRDSSSPPDVYKE